MLILDEFQEVVEIDPDLPKLMRSVFQEQPDVAHIYLGSKRHMMERIFSDENEPFWRSAKQMELGVIPVGALPAPHRGGLLAGRPRGGRRCPGRRARHHGRASLRHPGAVLLALGADHRQRGPGRPRERFGAALDAVLRSEYAHFSLVWDRATSLQRRVLLALAREPGRPLGSEYRRRHDLPGPSSVQRALQSLVREELVARKGPQHRIAEPFLAEWIVRDAS